jgi:hypothetical protein
MAKYRIEIASASDLRTIFDSLNPNDVRRVRSDELRPEEVSALNRHVVGNSYVCWVQATRENVETLAGIRLATEGEQPTVTIGGKGYVFDRNQHNRPLSKDRVLPVTKEGTYSNSMVRGLWGSMAGVLVFSDEAEIASAQHTLTGLLGALDAGEDLTALYLLCVFGLPPQFRDWSDKGRARNKVQDSFIDDTFFPEEVFDGLQLERTPDADKQKERLTLIAAHSKVAATVLNRMQGKDISKTGDKLSWKAENEFRNRFADPQTVEKLVIQVGESAKSQGGKADRYWLKLFDPRIVASGLILASNDEERIQARIADNVVRKPDESPEEYAERKLAYRASMLDDGGENLEVDTDLVTNVLSMLESSTDNSGPLASVFGDLATRKEKDKKSEMAKEYLYAPLSKPAMSAFVELVKNIRKGDTTSSVWTTYRLTDGKVSSVYRNFGGIDVGYIAPRKGKAKE